MTLLFTIALFCVSSLVAVCGLDLEADKRGPLLPVTDGSSFRGFAASKENAYRGALVPSVKGQIGESNLAGDVPHLLTFELGQKPVRTRRRRLGAQLEYEDTPLFPGYGTHFAYIYVGTPPQRVSVIVDTGSHFTAFPCVGCSNCGDHTDPYYDYETSKTGTVVGCDQCQSNFRCTQSAKIGNCLFSQSYSEGSTWSAFQVRDRVWVGELRLDNTPAADQQYSVEMMFGCISSQTGLFRTQLADGIMGMSANEYTLPWQMLSQGVVMQSTFSLCLAEGGGTMTLGGADPLLAAAGPAAPIAWTQISKESGWFTVEVVDVAMGGESLGVSPSVFNAGKGTIVDSGTTDTYFPTGAAGSFKVRWKKLTGLDYKNSKYSMTDSQAKALPTVTFTFRGGVKVTMLPQAYMEKTGNNEWTPRVYLNEGSGGVLGANFMRDHNVVFDHSGSRVGFQDADCDYARLLQAKAKAAATPQPTTPPPPTATATDCVHAGMKLVKGCDARCPLGASSASTVAGVETWGPNVTTPAKNGGKCPMLETRPCSIECKAGAPNPNNGGAPGGSVTGGCPGAGAWGSCSEVCEQKRTVSWPSGVASGGGGGAGGANTGFLDGCSQVTETRPCRVGGTCRYGAMGLVVAATLEACFPQVSAVAPTASAGDPADEMLWTASLGDAVADAAARLLAMDPGDVACGTALLVTGGDAAGGGPGAVANGGTGNGGGGVPGTAAASGRCYRVPLSVHLTPVVNGDLSKEVALALGGAGFGGQLARLANDDAQRRVDAAGAGPLTLAVVPPVAVLQAANLEPYAAALNRTVPPRRTSSGPVLVFGALALLALALCVFLGIAVLRRRMLGGAPSPKRAEYQLVDHHRSSNGLSSGISGGGNGGTGSDNSGGGGGHGGGNSGGHTVSGRMLNPLERGELSASGGNGGSILRGDSWRHRTGVGLSGAETAAATGLGSSGVERDVL